MPLVNFQQSRSANEIWKTSTCTCRTNRVSPLGEKVCASYDATESRISASLMLLVNFQQSKSANEIWKTRTYRTNRVTPLRLKVCAQLDATETRTSASLLFTSRIQEGALLARSKYSETNNNVLLQIHNITIREQIWENTTPKRKIRS